MSNNKSIKKLYGVVLSNLQDNSYTAQKVSSMPSRIEKLPGCKISVYVYKYNKSSSKITVSKPVSKNKKIITVKHSKLIIQIEKDVEKVIEIIVVKGNVLNLKKENLVI
uniref:Uncharacterized protein n=1 Tax=Moumouvirus sp. 'Monve' TaxID=1128131 RepID=H2EFZ6_9VIRU|nr:hypothetical protein mv_R846 [Moumouvirus Monve]